MLAHGFTQTARSWDTVATLLAARLPLLDIVAVDMPGHATTTATVVDVDVEVDRSPDLDLWQSADRLTQIGGRATYVGYSMGGRVALHAALADRRDGARHVERLILIGVTAGIDDPAERAERRRADDQLADRIEAIGVDAFVEEWLATPLFARLTPANDQRDDRRRNTAAGLASSLRATGTGTQVPLWDRLGEIEVPVLVLVGEEDPKFRTLGERLVSGLPRAELEVIAGAGHSVHLEAPTDTVDAIVRWMRDQDTDQDGTDREPEGRRTN